LNNYSDKVYVFICWELNQVMIVCIYVFNLKNNHWLVAPTYNPSYSGGRDQEDRVSKPDRANSSSDPILKKTLSQKNWAGGVAQGEGPDFKP
jgi:hypothetical protein